MKIALTPDEINKIASLQLDGTYKLIRDYFIIGCLTGLRFRDYSRIDKQHIINGRIDILTSKKEKRVVIPIAQTVQDILNSYGLELPTPPTQRYFNMSLPIICNMAGIRDIIKVETKVNGIVKLQQVPKYSMISTHTARRSFATNAYRAGIPVRNIMLITAHKTEETFFRYISIGLDENAQELEATNYFQKL